MSDKGYKPGRPAQGVGEKQQIAGVRQHKAIAMGGSLNSRVKVEQTKGGFQRKK